MSIKRNLGLIIFLFVFFVFIGIFLLYPIFYIFVQSFYIDGHISFKFFYLMFINPVSRDGFINSTLLSFAVLGICSVISFPLAFMFTRYNFAGKGLLGGLFLVPMVMPPFVGAIGMRKILSMDGPINLLLMKLHLINTPVDLLGGGFWAVAILEALHLYPILYLNLTASIANIDPAMEEAAKNLGAKGFRLFRTITLPLAMPGFFAGAIIVFIWAFTDLGTPLIFEFTKVIPVMIFNMLKDINVNPMGYAVVVMVIMITLLTFYISKKISRGQNFDMTGKGFVSSAMIKPGKFATGLIYAFCGLVIFAAIMPHLSVIFLSFSDKWFGTILPDSFTMKNFVNVFTHKLTLLSIKNSLLFSFASTILDLFLGVTIAYFLTRKKFIGADLLDTVAMLPLALPGIIIAFGYVTGFSGTIIDPRDNPVLLLIISYSVRRLPFILRASYAGFQQTSVSLEEASQNLGASPLKTIFKITLPLITLNLIAGSILVFSFSMLEVSDSLILAMKEKFFPITKSIYFILTGGVTSESMTTACALGVFGMILLTISLLIAGKFMGKRVGEIFRI